MKPFFHSLQRSLGGRRGTRAMSISRNAFKTGRRQPRCFLRHPFGRFVLSSSPRLQTPFPFSLTSSLAYSSSPASPFSSSSASSASLAELPISSLVPIDFSFTDSQIAQYRRDGFLVCPEFLSPAQLQYWRLAIDEAVKIRGGQKFADEGMDDLTNEDFDYYDNVFTQRVNLWQSHAGARRLVLEGGKTIGRMASALEGVDGMQLWHDQALVKEAWANATAWHVDNPYWSFSSKHAISFWLALDDATTANGCLFFVPGSHKVIASLDDPYAEVKIGKNMRDAFVQFPMLKGAQSVAAPMKAGSCSFHNGLTVHGAQANMTCGRRRAMTLQMMPSQDNRFNGVQNVLKDCDFASLKVGQKMTDPRYVPALHGDPES